MALPADPPPNPNSSLNPCCEAWKKKWSKGQEARSALRQAVKVLEHKISEVHADNVNLKKACEEERARAQKETEEKLKECNARMSLENEVCSLKSEIAAVQEKGGGDARDGNESVEGMRAGIADREKEISRLKELLEAEKKRADNERKNAEKERKKASEALKLVEVEKSKVVDKEKQISRVEAEKAAEYREQLNRLEKEANKAKMELASQISAFKEATKKFEAEKQKLLTEKRDQLNRLEKEANEAKTGLASQISASKEATKKFEAEKMKLLKEKRNAESGMAKAKEMLEIEKQKVSEEKKRADAEMVKVEEHKVLAESNWKKFMEERNLVNQMSQQVEEDKKTIEDLKMKITELSSPRKPTEMVGVSANVDEKAESSNVKLLKSQLKLEKLRAKYAKQKFKLEANRHSILRHEVARLKTDFIPILRRLDMLNASFSSFDERDKKTKSENIPYTQNSDVMREVCNVDRSQMHSQFGNEPRETCCTTMETCDPLRQIMQCTPLLALSGGNYSESIPGIDSKLKPPVKGSNNTKLQSSAVNSSSESFSDGQLMGSQEPTAFRVSAPPIVNQEVLNAGQVKCNSSDRFITENHRKRKHKHDRVECIANLPSQNLSDFHGLPYRKEGKCLEGGREIVHNPNSVQQTNGRVRKKRKKSHREEVVAVPQADRDVEKGTEETKGEAYKDANICKQTCPGSYNLETTPACGDRICDAANKFDSIISFGKVTDETYMKLFELDNSDDEQRYRRAVDSLLSPSLPEIEFHEAFDISLNKKAPQEDILSGRTELFPSPSLDVINSEINVNEQQVDVSLVSSDSLNKPTHSSETEVLKLPHMHTPENSRVSCMVDDKVGSLHNQLPKILVISSNVKDSNIVSRILTSTKACIDRCSLATHTVWAVGSILTALQLEEMLSHNEKTAVLLNLMLFNFVMTATKTFGKQWDGNIFNCLNSYAEHIRTVLSDAETRILFTENYSLPDLLGLIEDFLVEGKIIVDNTIPSETLLDCNLRSNEFLDCVNKLSIDVASSEQLLAGSIILASVCAATDHVGFTCEASCDILRSCKWDSLTVLTILHIFAYLGGEKFFDLDNFGSMVTILKSLVIFLEGKNLSVASPCLPSIDQLHAEFCKNRKCAFLEGAESIDTVACLLLEEIKNCLLHGMGQAALPDSRFMSDNNNARQWSNLEGVQKAINENCDTSCCLKKCMDSAARPGVHRNVTFCHFSDVLSLVELVANKMSWHWTDIKLVPQLMNILDSCVEENYAMAIIVLLGQLGRIGVDACGYEEQGVENLRCKLLAYLDHTSSMKAGISIQISAASVLFLSGLLPRDLETLVHTDTSLPAYSKSVSDHAETLRKWFSGLDEDQQKMLSSILRPQ